MPRGISEQFLNILDNETRRGWALLSWGVLAVLTGMALADLADSPRFGDVTVVFLLSLLSATLAAGLWARRAATLRTHALADQWAKWMRFSSTSATLREVEAKVRGARPPAPWVAGVVVAVFILLNALVFALLWFETTGALEAAFTMAALNGVAVGGLLGTTAVHVYWARSATEAARELVGRGAVSVWGER